MAIKDLISPGIGFAVASVEFIITRGLGQADTAPGPWRVFGGALPVVKASGGARPIVRVTGGAYRD